MRQTPSRLTSIVRSNAAGSIDATVPLAAMPALAMTTSSPPKRSTAPATAAWTASKSVTSASNHQARSPSSAARRSSSSGSSPDEGDRGAERVQPPRGLQPEPAGRSGDQDDLAGDVVALLRPRVKTLPKRRSRPLDSPFWRSATRYGRRGADAAGHERRGNLHSTPHGRRAPLGCARAQRPGRGHGPPGAALRAYYALDVDDVRFEPRADRHLAVAAPDRRQPPPRRARLRHPPAAPADRGRDRRRGRARRDRGGRARAARGPPRGPRSTR